MDEEKPLPESLCRYCFEEHGEVCIAKKNANYALYIGIIALDKKRTLRDPAKVTIQYCWDNWERIPIPDEPKPAWICGMKMRKLLHKLGENFSYQCVAFYTKRDDKRNIAKEIRSNQEFLKYYERIQA